MIETINAAAKILGWSRKEGFWVDVNGVILKKAAVEPNSDRYEDGYFRPDMHYRDLILLLEKIRQDLGVIHTAEWKGNTVVFTFVGQHIQVTVKGELLDSNGPCLKAGVSFYVNEKEQRREAEELQQSGETESGESDPGSGGDLS